jgi:hypothetical protein
MTIGRSPDCDILLPHRSVSRLHGLLEVGAHGGVTYQDRSSNGTTYGGVPVTHLVEVQAGEALRIGPYDLRLRIGIDPSVLEKTHHAIEPEAAFSGELEASDLYALVLALERTRATGVLTVRSPAVQGELLLRDGQLIDARTAAGEAGGEAARRLLRVEAGTFVFARACVTEPRRDGLRLVDLLPGAERRAPRETDRHATSRGGARPG